MGEGNDRYPVAIAWSAEEDAFIVTVPELPGCKTHGITYEEAARRGQDAIQSSGSCSRRSITRRAPNRR
jgi:hypothetical protein